MNLPISWEYADWICTYIENMQNAWKVKYLPEFKTKIEYILEHLSGAQMGSFGQAALNKKSSCKYTFKQLQGACW